MIPFAFTDGTGNHCTTMLVDDVKTVEMFCGGALGTANIAIVL